MSWNRTITTLGTITMVAFGLALPSAASATSPGARRCSTPAHGPKNDRSLPIGGLSVRNMTCSTADAAIARGTFAVHGSCFGAPGNAPCRATFRTAGFRCAQPSSGRIRCAVGRRVFEFGWGE
jgi:hypothetical protein